MSILYTVYTYPLWVQSIPSLLNLCVRWKLASQGWRRKVQAGLQASYLQLLSHTLLQFHLTMFCFPPWHLHSNRTLLIKPNQWVMTLNPDHNSNNKTELLCCHYSLTSSPFFAEFLRKFLPLYQLYPQKPHHPKLTFTAARVSSKGSS